MKYEDAHGDNDMIYKFASQKKIAAGEQIGKTYYPKGLRH